MMEEDEEEENDVVYGEVGGLRREGTLGLVGFEGVQQARKRSQQQQQRRRQQEQEQEQQQGKKKQLHGGRKRSHSLEQQQQLQHLSQNELEEGKRQQREPRLQRRLLPFRDQHGDDDAGETGGHMAQEKSGQGDFARGATRRAPDFHAGMEEEAEELSPPPTRLRRLPSRAGKGLGGEHIRHTSNTHVGIGTSMGQTRDPIHPLYETLLGDGMAIDDGSEDDDSEAGDPTLQLLGQQWSLNSSLRRELGDSDHQHLKKSKNAMRIPDTFQRRGRFETPERMTPAFSALPSSSRGSGQRASRTSSLALLNDRPAHWGEGAIPKKVLKKSVSGGGSTSQSKGGTTRKRSVTGSRRVAGSLSMSPPPTQRKRPLLQSLQSVSFRPAFLNVPSRDSASGDHDLEHKAAQDEIASEDEGDRVCSQEYESVCAQVADSMASSVHASDPEASSLSRDAFSSKFTGRGSVKKGGGGILSSILQNARATMSSNQAKLLSGEFKSAAATMGYGAEVPGNECFKDLLDPRSKLFRSIDISILRTPDPPGGSQPWFLGRVLRVFNMNPAPNSHCEEVASTAWADVTGNEARVLIKPDTSSQLRVQSGSRLRAYDPLIARGRRCLVGQELGANTCRGIDASNLPASLLIGSGLYRGGGELQGLESQPLWILCSLIENIN